MAARSPAPSGNSGSGNSGWGSKDIDTFISHLNSQSQAGAGEKAPQLGVDSTGRIVDKQAAQAYGVETTDLPAGTFSAAENYRTPDQLAHDREFACRNMPTGTREVTARNGVTGFVFGIRCSLGNPYTFF